MQEDQEAPRRYRRLLTALREDAEFRGTFLGAIVLPATCALGLIVWILLEVTRG